MSTLREKLTEAGITDQAQQAHLEAGYLAVGGRRVDDLDTVVPDGSNDFGIFPWPALSDEERAAVEAQVAAGRQAHADAERKRKSPTGFTD